MGRHMGPLDARHVLSLKPGIAGQARAVADHRPTCGTDGEGNRRRRAADAQPEGSSNILRLATRRPPRAPTLWLSRHCHACLADDHLIFLDLRTGTYGGLPPDQARAALAVLDCDHALRALSLPGARLDRRVLQDLLASRLVTTDPRRGKRLTSLSAVRATREAMGTGDGAPPRITARDAWHFLMALSGGALALRLLPLRAVLALERRRAARIPGAPAGPDAINRVVDQFLFLAPLFYSQRDRCLLNSLVLRRLLRRHGIAAHWVFGVAADPFEAHCWLQVGDAVAGDTLMRIWRLTPILIV